MSTFSIVNALAQIRDIGRGRVFYATTTQGGSVPHQWDGTTELFLKQMCDTEGAIAHEPNPEFARLGAPELIGPGTLKAKAMGENPTITVPAIYADPAVRALLSATGQASGGRSTWVPVISFTMVIFAEELFFNATTREYDLALDPNGGSWQFTGPIALSARQLQLLGLTCWAWNVFPVKAPFSFTSEDAGKSVQEVVFELMYDVTKPEYHKLYTIGNPYNYSIDIEGSS